MASFDETQFEREYLEFINKLKAQLNSEKKEENVASIENECVEIKSNHDDTEVNAKNEEHPQEPVKHDNSKKRVFIKKHTTIEIHNESNISDDSYTNVQEQNGSSQTFKSFVRGKRIFIDREKR